jgi:hypothetical protein
MNSRPRRLTAALFDLGQVKLWASEHRHSRWSWSVERRIARNLETPELSGFPGGDEIWAVGMVRDEADIVGSTVSHLLQQGVDHVLIADHGSTDGTLELLDDMARRDDRIYVARDHESGYFQREKMTRLS